MELVPLVPDLSSRSRQAEEMDAPGLEPARHERALQGLARINILSLAAGRAWTRIKDLPRSPGAPLRVLDVACGGGDIAVALKARAEKAGIPVDVEGCDLSPVALEVARKRASRRGLDIRFFQHDATEKRLPAGYDLVCSSLFLHHLSTGEASIFLERLAAGNALFVQDLLRTRLGYLLAVAGVKAVTRSRIVHLDGLRSVRAGFSLAEVHDLVKTAGLSGSRIGRCWPERFTIDWRADW